MGHSGPPPKNLKKPMPRPPAPPKVKNKNTGSSTKLDDGEARILIHDFFTNLFSSIYDQLDAYTSVDVDVGGD